MNQVELNSKYFINRYQLWVFLQPYCNGIDFNGTLRQRLGCIKMEDSDEVVFTHGSSDFFGKLNDKFNLKIDTKLSHFHKDRSTIFWEGDSIKKTSEEIVQDVVVNTPEIVHKQVVEQEEEVSESDSTPKEEETVVDVSEYVSKGSVKSVDWEWVESLENNKEDKLALDEYAQEFNVELSRRKTLENMIIDFKEAL